MKLLTIKLPSGETWGVPVDVIARNRAEHYAHEFDGDVGRSLAEDTEPLFEFDPYEVKDWAVSNMDWDDVWQYAVKVHDAPSPSMVEVWLNGEKDVIEYAPPEEQSPAAGLPHEHDAQFLGVALLVALSNFDELVLTAENIEAAMHFGLVSETSEDGETVTIRRTSRAEAEALMAEHQGEANAAQ